MTYGFCNIWSIFQNTVDIFLRSNGFPILSHTTILLFYLFRTSKSRLPRNNWRLCQGGLKEFAWAYISIFIASFFRTFLSKVTVFHNFLNRKQLGSTIGPNFPSTFFLRKNNTCSRSISGFIVPIIPTNTIATL